MPSFAYVARDRSGKTLKGVIDTPNIKEAAAKLRQDNLFITQLAPVGARTSTSTGSSKPDVASKGRISVKDKMFFTKQFYVMLKAGLGMIICLSNLVNQTSNKYMRYIIGEVQKSVEGGVSLSEALSKFSKAFDPMFIHMLEAGEASGKLDVSFARLNEYFERQYLLKKKVTSALVYPIIISIVAVVAVIMLMTIVLPTFITIFQDAGVELPMMTQILITVSDLMRRFWYLMVIFPVLLVFGYQAMKRNPKGREVLDQFWLKVPLFGDLLRKLAVSRFTRTLSTLLDSGVPLLQSLDIVQRAVNNSVIAKGIQAATVSVTRGSSLAQPLESSGMFPAMVSQMIAVGEDTGDLSHMLEEVADYYDKEVEYAVENLTTMIEPAIIVGLGGVVAFIVAAIMLPLFKMSSGATIAQ